MLKQLRSMRHQIKYRVELLKLLQYGFTNHKIENTLVSTL